MLSMLGVIRDDAFPTPSLFHAFSQYFFYSKHMHWLLLSPCFLVATSLFSLYLRSCSARILPSSRLANTPHNFLKKHNAQLNDHANKERQ